MTETALASQLGVDSVSDTGDTSSLRSELTSYIDSLRGVDSIVVLPDNFDQLVVSLAELTTVRKLQQGDEIDEPAWLEQDIDTDSAVIDSLSLRPAVVQTREPLAASSKQNEISPTKPASKNALPSSYDLVDFQAKSLDPVSAFATVPVSFQFDESLEMSKIAELDAMLAALEQKLHSDDSHDTVSQLLVDDVDVSPPVLMPQEVDHDDDDDVSGTFLTAIKASQPLPSSSPSPANHQQFEEIKESVDDSDPVDGSVDDSLDGVSVSETILPGQGFTLNADDSQRLTEIDSLIQTLKSQERSAKQQRWKVKHYQNQNYSLRKKRREARVAEDVKIVAPISGGSYIDSLSDKLDSAFDWSQHSGELKDLDNKLSLLDHGDDSDTGGGDGSDSDDGDSDRTGSQAFPLLDYESEIPTVSDYSDITNLADWYRRHGISIPTSSTTGALTSADSGDSVSGAYDFLDSELVDAKQNATVDDIIEMNSVLPDSDDEEFDGKYRSMIAALKPTPDPDTFIDDNDSSVSVLSASEIENSNSAASDRIKKLIADANVRRTALLTENEIISSSQSQSTRRVQTGKQAASKSRSHVLNPIESLSRPGSADAATQKRRTTS